MAGYFLTILQLSILVFTVLHHPFVPHGIEGGIFLGLSVIIATWAIWASRKTKINVFPHVRQGAKLVRNGPYRYVRHPMYTSVLLFSLSYLVGAFSLVYVILFIALLIVILIKIRFEEKKLTNAFDGYENEFYKTYRIIPCIY